MKWYDIFGITSLILVWGSIICGIVELIFWHTGYSFWGVVISAPIGWIAEMGECGSEKEDTLYIFKRWKIGLLNPYGSPYGFFYIYLKDKP